MSLGSLLLGPPHPPASAAAPPEGATLPAQVVLIGDGVGGILGFDALCHSASVGTGSRGSSRRGSMVSGAEPCLLGRRGSRQL